jgi:hypothetical protein
MSLYKYRQTVRQFILDKDFTNLSRPYWLAETLYYWRNDKSVEQCVESILLPF